MNALDNIIKENKKVRAKLNPSTEQFNINSSGIIFIHASWAPTLIQLNTLLKSLENFSHINLYIYDIDSSSYSDLTKIYKIKSHGYGETYWINKGVIFKMFNNYTYYNINQLILNNKELEFEMKKTE
jgi:hypothetical protein